MEDEARKVMAGIPALAGLHGPLERMGGLTNAVFRAGDAVLRLPGKGTEEYIDRANEAAAAHAAAAAGVSPEVLHVDPAIRHHGHALHRRHGVTMTPEAFRTRPGAPARAGRAFRQLHASGAVFPPRFELFAMIDDYLRVLSTKDVALPDGYHDVVAEAEGVRAALARGRFPRSPATAIPCARTSSIPARACGSSTGSTRA
jgi:thiamine kinase-like enzyme